MSTNVHIWLALAFVASRLLSDMLYNVQAADPWAYAGVTSWWAWPSSPASCPPTAPPGIDPVIALKHE